MKKIEKMPTDIYKKFASTLNRYLELENIKDKNKIDTAKVIFYYSMVDLEEIIDKYNSGKNSTDLFYRSIIKTDFLIGSLEYFYKVFKSGDKKSIYQDENSVIRKFRLIRSLVIAHPLETTRYKEFGYGKDSERWCEDVMASGSAMYNLINKDFSDSDYTLTIRLASMEYSEKRPVYLEKDILSAALVALNRLEVLESFIKEKLDEKLQLLKKTPIKARRDEPIEKFIQDLKEDLKIRYPLTIEIIQSGLKIYEVCILNDALDMLQLKYEDQDKKIKYEVYKSDLLEKIYLYAEAIQNMNLEESETEERLIEIVSPSYSILSSKSHFPKANYMYSKIDMYLEHSNDRSIDTAIEKLSKYSYAGCTGSEVCTDAEWACIQLFLLKDEISPFFNIDFDSSDKELLCQYKIALYFANCQKS